MKKILIGILFISFLSAAVELEPIYKKSMDFFDRDEFEKGIEYLEQCFKDKEKTERYYRYKSFLASFFIKQSWEQGRGGILLLQFISKIKSHNQTYLKAYPKVGSGHVGLGEHYQYTPKLLGGGIEKAEREFNKAIQKQHTAYDLYKVLLFYMNKKTDYAAAEKLLVLFDKIPVEDVYFSRYIGTWLKYQKAVIAFKKGKLKEVKTYLSDYPDHGLDAHWAAYILYQTAEAEGRPGLRHLKRAYQIALTKKNQAFIKRLKKENPTPFSEGTFLKEME